VRSGFICELGVPLCSSLRSLIGFSICPHTLFFWYCHITKRRKEDEEETAVPFYVHTSLSLCLLSFLYGGITGNAVPQRMREREREAHYEHTHTKSDFHWTIGQPDNAGETTTTVLTTRNNDDDWVKVEERVEDDHTPNPEFSGCPLKQEKLKTQKPKHKTAN